MDSKRLAARLKPCPDTNQLLMIIFPQAVNTFNFQLLIYQITHLPNYPLTKFFSLIACYFLSTQHLDYAQQEADVG